MSRTVSLATLRSKLERYTDTENDPHLSTTEKNEILAYAASEAWDELIDAGLAEQFVKKVTFSSTAGTVEHVIDETIVTDDDFYKIYRLCVDEGGGYLRPVERINPSEIQGLTAPSQSVNMVLYYIPAAPTFKTSDVYDNTATIEGFNGWDEYIVLTACIAVCLKKDRDFRQFYNRKAELKKRIESMAKTDWSQPARVVRRYNKRRDPWVPFTNGITCYALVGGKLELYVGGPLYGYPHSL